MMKTETNIKRITSNISKQCNCTNTNDVYRVIQLLTHTLKKRP